MRQYWRLEAHVEHLPASSTDASDALAETSAPSALRTFFAEQESAQLSAHQSVSTKSRRNANDDDVKYESNTKDPWNERVNLIRYEINLDRLPSRQPQLPLRTNDVKRKAADALFSDLTESHSSKSVKLENARSTEPSTDRPVNGSSKLRVPCEPQFPVKLMKVGRSKSFRSEFKDGRALDGACEYYVRTPAGKDLCSLTMNNLEGEADEIFHAVSVLTSPSRGCPCRTDIRLGLASEGAESRIFLAVDLFWKLNSGPLLMNLEYNYPEWKLVSLIARSLTPTNVKSSGQNWEPRIFYESVYTPPHDPTAFGSKEVPELRTGLYGFQQRTLNWLLMREGCSPNHLSKTDELSDPTSIGFYPVQDLNGQSYLFSGWLQQCRAYTDHLINYAEQLRGGVLAEEMGLGKTVEILSLIITNKRPMADFVSSNGLRKVPTTLIIAPKSIIQQWKEEIDLHAPSLEVMIYAGMKTHSNKGNYSDEELIELIYAHDVVLVTYETISKEIWFATDPPDRSRRFDRKYQRRKSPLVQLDWWRVVLDEAQMIESGVTNAAKVAMQLSRRNAWAVTGTPLKKDTNDLFGLLTFLRLAPFMLSMKLWNSLLANYLPVFKQMTKTICLRHSKDQVRAELQLPSQKRIIVSVPFTAVEEQNYNELFEEMVKDCGLDLDGQPEPDVTGQKDAQIVNTMRAWLARLRQICLHPEVGERNRRALGRRDGGPLRTVGDVLQVMFEQNQTSLRTEERSRLQSMLRRGQILEFAKKPEDALVLWRQVEAEAIRIAEIDRAASSLAEQEEQQSVTRSLDASGGFGNDQAGNKSVRLKNRLRVSLEVQHTATFFIANALFQIKNDTEATEPASERFKELEEMETQKYEEAKQLRRQLLVGAAEHAGLYMQTITLKRQNKKFVQLTMIEDFPINGGVETRKYVDQLDSISRTLNQQAELVQKWRRQLVDALCSPLVDQEETELTGEEYEKSTKEEDQIHAYVEAIRLIIADRSQVLTGQKNTNVRREATNLLRNAIAGEGHAPELMKQVLTECNQIRIQETQQGDIEICLRGLITQLNHHRGSIDFHRGESIRSVERKIIDNLSDFVRPLATRQQKIVTALEKELDAFSDTVNARVEYYRQLQEISDHVAPYEEEMSDHERIARLVMMQENEAQCQKRIDRLRSKEVYLNHLKSDSTKDVSERKCIICQDTFEIGCLTVCGHVYCKECILLWWKTHRNCPTCKAKLARSDIYPISYKFEISIHEQGGNENANESKTKQQESAQATSIYSTAGQQTLDEIKSLDLRGSYGSKIDMLTRHLLWIRQHDPGAKAVVFSQFRDFLGVLEHAFSRSGIGWASIESGPEGVERFKKDPGTECLLLHAKAQASGLNLINATHVFICEPLINSAIELQVIARVHRIGQHSPTTIWMYIVDGTVEKAVYEISVSRRLAHMHEAPTQRNGEQQHLVNGLARQQADFETEIDAANSLEMEQAPTAKLLAGGRSSGEQVAKEDLWPCLFKYRPNLRNNVLVDDDNDQNNAAIDDATHTATTLSFLAGEAAESRRDGGVAPVENGRGTT